MKYKHALLALSMTGIFSAQAWSQTIDCNKSYAFRADVNGSTGTTLCDAKSDTFLDAVKNLNLSNSNYTETSPAQVLARFSDVTLNLSYNANSSILTSSILGETRTFDGANRTASQDLFVEYIKKDNILGRIMKYQAENSATSPIAGAGGLIPMVAAADFGASFDTSSKIATGAAAQGEDVGNLLGVSPSYGSFKVDGSDDKVSTVSFPFSYTIRNDIDPRRQLIFSLPITQVSIGNAKSYHGGLGLAYRLPLTDNWTITPGAKYSVVGSVDRATVSSVMSASLMSTYVIPLSGLDIAIGNMVGYYKTGKFSSGDYSFDPDIKYALTRNGVLLSQPLALGGRKMSIEYSLIDTRYLGDKPFVDNTQEIGITIGTNKSAANARSYVRGGVSYLRGKDMNGLTANVGYWF